MFKRILLAVFCITVFCGPAGAQSHSEWVATWGTATELFVDPPAPWMQPPPEDDNAAAEEPAETPPSPIPPVLPMLDDQTVRMIIRSSIGGEKIRLQFSNARGLPPVTLGAVHVAVHGDGPSIVPGSNRQVSFGGNTSVTIHPGAMVVSDPLDLPVPALTELAVSVYLPESADTRARHELGLNTTYIGNGNQAAATTLKASETNRSYLWLTGAEVLAEPGSGTIVAFGDSITDGYSTTPDRHQAWPALLAERLQQNPATANLGVINMGISGNRVLRDLAGASALTRFDRDVLSRAGVEWIILLEGINDINFTALPGIPASQQTTAAEIIAGLSQLVDRAHARGIRVMGATLTPMGGLWLHNDLTEGMRQEVNNWIRNSGKYDAVVDFDAVTRDPQQPTRFRAEVNSGDHIHPNDAGNVSMAQAIDLAVFTQP